MPEGVQADQINSSYSSDGILTIQAPRVIKAPEGATVQVLKKILNGFSFELYQKSNTDFLAISGGHGSCF